MLREAVAQLGPAASRAGTARRARALDALSVLVAPDGDVELPRPRAGAGLGAGARRRGAGRRRARRRPPPPAPRRPLPRRRPARGAAARGAPRGAAGPPGRARRGDAHDARRDRRLRATPSPTTASRCSGSPQALDALAAIPAAPVGDAARPTGRLSVVADERGERARHRRQRPRLARRPQDGDATRNDLRHDSGALALKRRTPAGWVDLLAPRPLTRITPDSSGPALMRLGEPLKPVGFGDPRRPLAADHRRRVLRQATGCIARIARVPLAADARRRPAARRRRAARRPLPDARLHAGRHRAAARAARSSPPARAGASTARSACAGFRATIPARSSASTRWRRGCRLRGPAASSCGSEAESASGRPTATALRSRHCADPCRDSHPARLLPLALSCRRLPAAGAHAFTIGMSDQKTGMWQDPRFEQLGHPPGPAAGRLRPRSCKGDFSRYDPWMARRTRAAPTCC